MTINAPEVTLFGYPVQVSVKITDTEVVDVTHALQWDGKTVILNPSDALVAIEAVLNRGFEPGLRTTPVIGTGKYRLRTAIRAHLPAPLTAYVPKGGSDCGNHDWYRSDEKTWRCYHCVPGVTHEVPWDETELAARELEAEAMRIRGGRR